MKWLRILWITTWILCLFAVPIHGVEQCTWVDAVSKPLLLQEQSEPVGEVRTGLLFGRGQDDSFRLYLEFSGLAADREALWLKVTLGQEADGEAIVETVLQCEAGQSSAWIELDHHADTVTLNLFLYEEEGGQLLYQPVAMLVGLQEALPFNQADAAACAEPAESSFLAKKIFARAYLLPDTLESHRILSAQLLDQAGAVRAVTEQAATISEYTVPDSRYEDIFQNNPYEVIVQGLDVEFILSETLEVGNYDVAFLDEQGETLYLFEDLVVCDERPVAEIMGWTEIPGAGESEAGVTLFLAKGIPEAFQIALYQGETQLGRSTHSFVLDVDGQTTGAYLCYPIPLEKPLEEDSIYTAQILSEEIFHGERQCLLVPVRQGTGTIYEATASFDSGYFANVVFDTAGFQKRTQYRATLSRLDGQQEELLSEQLAVVDENGLFNIEFTDENCELIPLDVDTAYRVGLYRWKSGNDWELVDAVDLKTESMESEGGTAAVTSDRQMIHRVPVSSGVTVRDGGGADVQLHLQEAAALMAAPGDVFDLTEKNQYALAGASLHTAQRYRADYRIDGQPVGCELDGYWVTVEQMEEYQKWISWGVPPFYELTLDPVVNGTIQLFCGTETAFGDSSWAGFSEIYVQAIPARGYVLDTILVNGVAITGRAFLLTENARITVIFKPRDVETFAITAVHSADSDLRGGSITSDVSVAALWDTVTLSADIEAHYLLADIRCYERDSGIEIPLTPGKEPNTWSFSMPGTPVTVEATFEPQMRGKIGVLEYDTTAGSFRVETEAWVGDRVMVSVEIFEGCHLKELSLVYQLDGEVCLDLLAQPDEMEGTYFFIMPGVTQVWIRAVFDESRFLVTVEEPVQEGGTLTISSETARPGTIMTVTAHPAQGYQLQLDTLSIRTAGGAELEWMPGNVANTWSFVMPWEDVLLSGRFERIVIKGPGGPVSSVETLIAALGGDQAAGLLQTGTNTVGLKNPVELAAPVAFTGGVLTLDLQGSSLSCAFADQALLVVEAGAEVTLCSNVPEGVVQGRHHGVWVKGGKVVFEAAVQIQGSTQGDGLRVTGGTAHIHGGSFSGAVGIRAVEGGGLYIRGGTVSGSQGAAVVLSAPLLTYLEESVIARDPATGAEYNDSWVNSTSPTGAVSFAQLSPAVNSAGIVVKAQTGKVELSVPITHPTEGLTLLSAVYDADGRMLGAQMAVCRRGTDAQTLTVTYSGTPACVRLFFGKSGSLQPLSDNIELDL